MKKILPLFILISLLLSSCAFWGLTDSRIAGYIEPGGFFDFSLDNNTLYVQGSDKLLEYDTGDISASGLQNSFDVSVTGGFAVKDNILYYLNDNVLTAYSLADETMISSIDNITVNGSDEDLDRLVIIEGNYLYCGDFNIVDISNPYAISRLGGVSILQIHDFEIMDQVAYITNAYGLTILDCTVPAAPVVSGRLADLSEGNRNIEISGSNAYINNWGLDLIGIIDINNPAAPVLKSTLSKSIDAMVVVDMEMSGSSLYLAQWYIGESFSSHLVEYSVNADGSLSRKFGLEQGSNTIDRIDANSRYIFMLHSGALHFLER